MAEQEATYRDPSENNFPNDYDESNIDSRIKLRTNAVRQKMYGVDVRGALAQAVEIGGAVAGDAKKSSDSAVSQATSLNQRWDEQINGHTEPNELIDFRHSDMLAKSFDTSKKRGDFFDTDLQERAVNVKWFGALGDRTTDDSQAFLDAIEMATNNSLPVYVPSGKYVLSTPLNLSGIRLFGAHVSSTYLFTKGLANLFSLGIDSQIDRLTIVNQYNGADINNIVFGETISSGGNQINRINIKGRQDGGNKSTGFFASPKGTEDVNTSVFPNIIKDVELFDVADGIVFDSANYGWVNGNAIENATIHGFSHSAIWLNASAANGSGISHNIFKNIQAEMLPGIPADARAFKINCGVNNRFEMCHTWTDGGTSVDSIEIKGSEFLKNEFQIKDNHFDGIIESGIDASVDYVKQNDLSGLIMNNWIDKKFNSQVNAIRGFVDVPRTNLLSSDLVQRYSESGIVSPLQFGGSLKATSAKVNLDEIGNNLEFSSLVGDSNAIFIPLNGKLNTEIRTLKKYTIGYEFSTTDDVSTATILPSMMFYDSVNDKPFAPVKALQSAAQRADGTYRYMMTVDNSIGVASEYAQAFISLTFKGFTNLKLRKAFLVAGVISPNSKIDESHFSKQHNFTVGSGASLSSYSDVAIFLYPKSKVSNYPDFEPNKLTKQVLNNGKIDVSYPLYY